MVVQIVHINSIGVVEPKRYPPVARDGYRMVSPQASLERVQAEAGDIHTYRAGTPIEGGENAQEFRDMPWGDLCRSPLFVEFSQAAMPECPDHLWGVWCRLTIVND